jgi:hypothetical protein
MPIPIAASAPTLLFRRAAFERVGLTRAGLDERFGLTDAEFHVEGDLIAVGPIYQAESLAEAIEELEGLGLEYFEDFCELSGNWPEWLAVFAMARQE